MNNALIYIIGYPGVGKLTVARAICAATGARLFDNHLVNNVIFSLIETDGKTPIPDPIWDEIGHVRDAALRVIAHHAPRHLTFVLTNVLVDDAEDRAMFAQVESAAAARDALYVPVALTCTEEENMRRLVAPDRIDGLKETDVATARERRRTEPILAFRHRNRLDLDNTDLSPDDAAAAIIAHVGSLTP